MRLRRKASKLDVVDLLEIAAFKGVPALLAQPRSNKGPLRLASLAPKLPTRLCPRQPFPLKQPGLLQQRLLSSRRTCLRTRRTSRARATRTQPGRRAKSRTRRRRTTTREPRRRAAARAGRAAQRVLPRCATAPVVFQGPQEPDGLRRCSAMEEENVATPLRSRLGALARLLLFLWLLLGGCQEAVPQSAGSSSRRARWQCCCACWVSSARCARRRARSLEARGQLSSAVAISVLPGCLCVCSGVHDTILQTGTAY